MFSLSYFIQRSKTISLYRSLLKTAAKIDDVRLKQSIKKEISEQFHLNSKLKDAMATKAAFLEGHRILKQLESMLPESNDSQKLLDIPAAAAALNSIDQGGNASNQEYVVGVGWPWESK